VPAFSARYPKFGKNVATFPENLQKTVKLQLLDIRSFKLLDRPFSNANAELTGKF